VGEHTLEARFALRTSGVYVGAVETTPGQVLPLPPLSLPYSPEFEPRADPEEGRATLREVARITGGTERTAWDDVFSTRGLRNRQVRDLVIPLALILLLLHLTEIAGRRLLLFAAAPEWLRSHVPSFASVGALWSRLRMPRRVHRRPQPEVAAVAPAAMTETVPDPAAVSSAMARAKSKAKSRVER
jgi:hypothetical protein